MSVYTIAGLPFEVEGNVLDAPLFRNYHPFRTNVPTDAPRLFTMRFGKVERPAEAETCRYRIDKGLYRMWLYLDFYVVEFILNGKDTGCLMHVNKDWSQASR